MRKDEDDYDEVKYFCKVELIKDKRTIAEINMVCSDDPEVERGTLKILVKENKVRDIVDFAESIIQETWKVNKDQRYLSREMKEISNFYATFITNS